jgi:hypothetical protein
VTEKWLKRHKIPYKMLFMRPNNDKGADNITKRRIYDNYLNDMDIIRVYDDRPQVVKVWESLGLDVINVGSGKDF